MVGYSKTFLPLLFLTVMSVPDVTGFAQEAMLEKSDVFPAGMDNVTLYRIPGIVVTPNGTVLAYCEARRDSRADWGEIEVHLRRSTDGGKTWLPPQHIAHHALRIEGNPKKKDDQGSREQTVNNPVAIVDHRSGEVQFLYCVNYARCFSMKSSDDGASWTEPVEITQTFEAFREHYDWKVIATGPGHGIQLSRGRLVVPIWLAYGKVGDHSPSASATIYSDDGGKTWHAGDIAVPNQGEYRNPNESMLAKLSDDRVLMISRSVSKPNRKLVTFSPNGATDWSEPRFHEDLLEPVCMASVLQHPSGLLFSNPHTVSLDEAGKEKPAGRGPRRNLQVKLSLDAGQTWAFRRTLESGPSAYSDLAFLEDGTILCLYEGHNTIACARFNMAWVKGSHEDSEP